MAGAAQVACREISGQGGFQATFVSRIFLGTAYEISQMKIRGAPSAQVDRLVDGLIALLRSPDSKPPA